MTSEERLDILKEILLTNEREPDKDILLKIQALEKSQASLSDRIEPILDKRLSIFVDEMPQTLGPTITEVLKVEIKKSQEAVAEALFPIMGKMIKKYVQSEIAKLNDAISQKINNTFSFRNPFGGNTRPEHTAAGLLKQEHKAFIEQVVVIEKGSGLLKANFSRSQTIDQDMLAGMLTAIKSFAEDAFERGEMELERIDYQLFTIHLQNFSNYYIAVVISGIYDDIYKDKLEDVLLDFAQFVINKEDLTNEKIFQRKLKEFFINDERI